MKERPILFNGEMVRAILDGRKAQTRRPMKEQPNPVGSWLTEGEKHATTSMIWCEVPDIERFAKKPKWQKATPPLGTVGDRLWVRETFCYNVRRDEGGPAYWYAATDPEPEACDEDGFARYRADGRSASPWIPSIHMPRCASRIDLEITRVWVERVQDIAEEDAKKEGIVESEIGRVASRVLANYKMQTRAPAVLQFADLWQSIYGTWDANPWVWAYEFRRINAK